MSAACDALNAARAELRLKTKELADGTSLLRIGPDVRPEDLRSYTRDLENRKGAVERAIAAWTAALAELEATQS